MTAVQPQTTMSPALVRHGRFNELHQDIRLCQDLSDLAGEAQCMALEGMTGTGKTTLVKSYASAFTRQETTSKTKIPVFYMETPTPVTVKGMAARMLETLGDPAAHRGPLWSMNSRLIHFLRLCEVQLVILDDFHHLIDQETKRILETVSDWLKVLIKETNIPFLVVGLEGSVTQILQANAQLSRLFAVRETLYPFAWSITDVSLNQDFVSFIQYVETSVPLSFSDELPRAEWLHRLHYATDGVIANVMDLVRLAVWLAHQQHAQTLSLTLLSQAFDKRLAQHLPQKTNPFVTATTQHFTTAPTSPTDASDSVSRRGARRQKRPVKTVEILQTK